MELRVAAEIWDIFPDMSLVLVAAEGLSNVEPALGVEKAWKAAWAHAGSLALPNPQSHPHVASWRQAFKRMGVSPREYPPAVESLLRRAMRGGEPFHVNPMVDFYNSVSLAHITPIGGFSLDHRSDVIDLRLTRTGDSYLALDAEEPIEVAAGEVAYADASTLLTRHFLWRQAREGLIHPTTTDVLLVSELPGDLKDELEGPVMRDLAEGIRRHFGCAPTEMVVDRDHPVAAW